jgi:hypothetical protein
MSRKTFVFILVLLGGVLVAVMMMHPQAPPVGDGIAAAKTILSPLMEPADILYNFQGMPLEQAVDVYQGLAGRKVRMPAKGWSPSASVTLVTAKPLTKHQAMRALEDAFKQQAHITIRHAADGSLSAVMDPVGRRR